MSIPKQWPEIKSTPPFPILQVATSTQVAQFNLLLPHVSKHSHLPEIWAEGEYKIKPVEIRTLINSDNLEWQLLRVKFADLLPNIEYSLKIVVNEMMDCRWFKTLPPESEPLRFAFSNCLNDETFYIEIQKDIYTQLNRERPDLLILGGDLVYVDSRERWYNIPEGPQAQDCLIRYLETWHRLDLFKLPYLIPTIAIWDDHDYGINDGDLNFPHKETTLWLHRCFYGADDIDKVFINFNLGRIGVFTHSSQAFFLLDNRYFRLHDDLEIYPEIDELDYSSLYQYFIQQYSKQRYNLLGQEQEEWLLAQASSHRFIWLVGGNQFFGNHHQKESYSRSNPEQFYHFLARMKATEKRFAILSGDLHIAEFSRYQIYGQGEQPIYEFGVGPMHSTMKLSDCLPDCYERLANPYRIRSEKLREENPHLSEETLEKLANCGLACFRYNFAVFTTKFVENGLETKIKLVTDNCNPFLNFTTII
ncbi:alkaline phosphatase D family protein [Gloeocapsa sp. PCC 73106]|uniref:alkaline phosphatase D family protein n=1 Tax=Gloeocapsa sp. PCC 73106 TaxID=102232 RepID=UPI0002AC58EE|nr:alkaline phosphatase D family protein [Gloeocapsa sp. PCC 73106]ELR98194.1 phosphodiesterase/alkaline phosphatase D [Gloeocapsa sp. PCC 73106]